MVNKIEKTLLPRNSRKETSQAVTEAVAEAAMSARDPEPVAPAPASSRFDRIFSRGNKREETPSPARDSAAHTASAEDAFYDFGDDRDSTEASPMRIDRTPVRDTRRFITEEEIRAYNKPPSFMAKLFSTRNILLALIAAGAGVAGFIFGVPLYHEYLAGKQSDEALPVVTRASEEVDAFIRKNLYFPDALTGQYDTPLYTVRLNAQDEVILLTFSQEAAQPLRGHSLTMESYNAPNLGLQWRCDISAGFPPTHKPAQCR